MPRALRLSLLAAFLVALPALAGLTPALHDKLERAQYVYIQSERKGGGWSLPSEIWFFVDGDTVYVGTRPTSWRVKRIQAGRTKARIAIGNPSGTAFEATGALVKNPAVEKQLMEAFAKKYPAGWANHAKGFEEGFKSGERVLVGYTAN
ncbi:MAG: hypothetical protein KIT14_05355 [bacterium]|nr:hypothetical protein [bacterium]